MRIDVIDIIKGIAIIMIVNVHLISGQFFLIGGTFHVIAFFFTAGIIHGINEKWEKMSVCSFVKQRASRLLYPYYALSICYICFHLFLNYFREDNIINVVITSSLINTIVFKGVGTLWFLPVLFLGEMLFFVAKKNGVHDGIILSLGVLSVFLSSYLNAKGICGIQWYGDSSIYGFMINNPLSLFLAGCITVMYIELGYLANNFSHHSFLRINHTNKQIIILGVLCIGSFLLDYFLLEYYAGDLHKLNIGNPLIYLVCSFTGILFVCSLSMIIERYCSYLRSLLIFFGLNSLIIMTTHTEYYINSISYVLITSLASILNISLELKIVSCLSLILIFIIEIGIVYIVNHSILKYIYTIPIRKNEY